MIDVALGGPGLVAVGSAGSASRPAVWLSADGTAWSRLPDEISGTRSGVEIGESTVERMTLVAAGEAGLLAIGPTPTGPAVWTSIDGYEWHLLRAEFLDAPIATFAVVDDVDCDGDLLVAGGGYVGTWSPPLVALWVSTDGGATWHVGSEAELLPDAWGISDTPMPSAPHLARYGSSIVVVGNDAVPTEEVINGFVQHARIIAVWTANMAEE